MIQSNTDSTVSVEVVPRNIPLAKPPEQIEISQSRINFWFLTREISSAWETNVAACLPKQYKETGPLVYILFFTKNKNIILYNK